VAKEAACHLEDLMTLVMMMGLEGSQVSLEIWVDQEAKELEDNRDLIWEDLGSLQDFNRWEAWEEKMEFLLSALVELLLKSEEYCHDEMRKMAYRYINKH
jgi:hypothetical protein